MIGLIPAAGKGTRLEPLTRALPKEMLQVGEKPIIDHVIDQFREAGIEKVFIVVGYRKEAIINYLGNGSAYGMSIAYLFQEKREGLAKAIEMVKDFANEQFCVVLGDNYIEPKDLLKEMIEQHNSKKASVTLAVHEREEVSSLGVVKLEESSDKIVDLVEKPPKGEEPSKLAIMGMYVFNPEIFDAIAKTKPGAKDEYQITDSIKILAEEGKEVHALEHKGAWFDIGTKEGLLEANQFALK